MVDGKVFKPKTSKPKIPKPKVTLTEFLNFLIENDVKWWSFQTVLDGAMYARSKKRRPRASFAFPDDIPIVDAFDYNYILVGISWKDLHKAFPKFGDLEKALDDWKKCREVTE